MRIHSSRKHRQPYRKLTLYLQSPALAIRLDDCPIDPWKEFAKVVEAMSFDHEWGRVRVVPPRPKPYRHLTVRERVPRFRDFIDGLDAGTKRRIEKIGYNVAD
jgi:hypothetical protein